MGAQDQTEDPVHAAALPHFKAYMRDLNANARIHQTDGWYNAEGKMKFSSNFTNHLWLAYLSGFCDGQTKGGEAR